MVRRSGLLVEFVLRFVVGQQDTIRAVLMILAACDPQVVVDPQSAVQIRAVLMILAACDGLR